MFYVIVNNNFYTAENREALYIAYPTEEIKELPADFEARKYIVQNNELVYNPEWDNIQLIQAKQNKVTENDTIRDEVLVQGVLYQDILFDSDTDQKINLLATVNMMSDEDTIIWYGMNNDYLECTKEDLFNIGQLIINLHSFCWTKNATIKQAIEDATTIEEVEAIEIDYTL